jgi:hypothetical protein
METGRIHSYEKMAKRNPNGHAMNRVKIKRYCNVSFNIGWKNLFY